MNHKLIAAMKPWYRHPWPWILMSGPFIVIVAGVFTTYLAVISNDGLVDDDYYKQGLAVNQMSARDQQAVRLGLQAEVMQGAGGEQIRVMLRGKTDLMLPDVLVLRITHPTRAGVDQNVILRSTGPGVYGGKLSAPLKGRWHVGLEDEKRTWRLTADWVIEKNAVLRMPAEENTAPGSGVEPGNR